jgi:hypothetical protein
MNFSSGAMLYNFRARGAPRGTRDQPIRFGIVSARKPFEDLSYFLTGGESLFLQGTSNFGSLVPGSNLSVSLSIFTVFLITLRTAWNRKPHKG